MNIRGGREGECSKQLQLTVPLEASEPGALQVSDPGVCLIMKHVLLLVDILTSQTYHPEGRGEALIMELIIILQHE